MNFSVYLLLQVEVRCHPYVLEDLTVSVFILLQPGTKSRGSAVALFQRYLDIQRSNVGRFRLI